MEKKIRVLLIEDSEDDALLIFNELKKNGIVSEHKKVCTAKAMDACLEKDDWDIIISDYRMPGFSGMDALKLLKKKDIDIPFIIISGTVGEDVAVQVMKQGANDYLLKDNLIRLASAVEREIRESENRRKKKEIEKVLLHERQELQHILDSMPFGIIVVDKNKNILRINRSALALTGYRSSKEVVGKLCHSTLCPAEEGKCPIHDLQVKIDRSERILIKKDGKQLPILKSAVPIELSGEQVILETFIDITDRKEIEEKLRSRETFVSTILENIPNMIFVKDAKDLHFVQFNKAGEELLGYPREKLIGKNDYDFFPKEEADYFTKKDKEVIKNRKYVDIPEETIQTKKNGERILHTKKIPLCDEKGKPEYLMGISEDITERKNAEKSLIESEARYKGVVENSRDGIVVSGKTGILLFVNKAMEKISGYSSHELMGNSFTKLVHPDTADLVKKKQQLHMSGKEKLQNYDASIKHKSGSKIFVNLSVSVLNYDGESAGLIFVKDITDKKKIENALNESEEKYIDLYENAPDMYCSVDPKTACIITCNETLAANLGYKKDKIIGKPIFSVYHPDSIEDAKKAFQSFVKTGVVKDALLQLKRKDGTKIDVSLNVSSVRDEKGNILYSRSVWRDVSEQIKTGKALKSSEERFALAMQGANDGLWDWNLETNELYYSPRWKSMIGYAPEELENSFETWERLIHPDDLVGANHAIADYLEGRTSKFELEFRMLHKKGNWVDILSRGFALKDEKGKPVRLVGTHVDITERNLIQEEIKSVARFPEENPHPILRFSKYGAILYANNAGMTLLSSWKAATNKPLPDHLKDLIKDSFESGVSRSTEIEHEDKTISLTFAPVQEAGYVNAYGLDITELKKLSKMKDEFISTVSHELRTPLTIIKEGIVQVWEGLIGSINPRQKEYLSIIIEAIDRLNRIITDLLDISKIEAGKMQMRKEWFDIKKEAKRLADTYNKLARTKHILVETNLPKKTTMVFADERLIGQVLQNLMENSFKFTEKGSITLTVIEKEKEIECSVADTGKGIAEEDMPLLFDRFRQFGRMHGPGIQGTGLGLAITKGLIELHGGRIRVESKPDKGTTIHFTIPKEEQK